MNKNYNIIVEPKTNEIYVTVLTKGSTCCFWSELSQDILQLNKPNTMVYFDYLYRNGLSNRLFFSKTNEYGMCSLSLKTVSQDMFFDISIFNTFFIKNINYIKNSRLTKFQKLFFERKVIKNNFEERFT